MSPEVPTSSRPDDPARRPPETAERLGRLTFGRGLLGIVALSTLGTGIVAIVGFSQCVRTIDSIGAGPTCAQCQVADPHAVIVRGDDTVATIVELATLPPEGAADDSLRMYLARLRRGHSIGPDVVAVASNERPSLELRPRDSVSDSPTVGRLFIEGVDHSIEVLRP